MAAATMGERAAWALLILLVVGYLVGAWLNRRRSKMLGQWLQLGVAGLGGKPSWRWVRSITSGAEVTLTGLGKPIDWLQVGYFLLTREVPMLWGIELLRGRRDLLSIRADLQTAPAQEYEVVPQKGRLRRMLERSAGESPWDWQDMPHGLALAARGAAGPSARALDRFVERYGAHIERLSVRRRQPHFVLFLRLGTVEKAPAAELLGAVRRLAGASRRDAVEA